MEEERKQISKRVEKAEQKARALPNFDALNQAAKRLRLERQKSEEIQMQIREQRTQLGCPLRRLKFFFYRRARIKLQEFFEKSNFLEGVSMEHKSQLSSRLYTFQPVILRQNSKSCEK